MTGESGSKFTEKIATSSKPNAHVQNKHHIIILFFMIITWSRTIVLCVFCSFCELNKHAISTQDLTCPLNNGYDRVHHIFP